MITPLRLLVMIALTILAIILMVAIASPENLILALQATTILIGYSIGIWLAAS